MIVGSGSFFIYCGLTLRDCVNKFLYVASKSLYHNIFIFLKFLSRIFISHIDITISGDVIINIEFVKCNN